MKLYNELYKSSEMPFGEHSRFFVEDDREYVTFGIRVSANFSESYQTELVQSILSMFDFKDFSTTNMVTFLLPEALDRIPKVEDRKLFIYLISKCMCIKRFSGTIENKINLNEKDLRYKKVKFKKMLQAVNRAFLEEYAPNIYSAIVDSAESVVGLCEPDAKKHSFAYKLTLIAKEYTDDLIARINESENAGYPRINKILLKNRPLESARRILERAKTK